MLKHVQISPMRNRGDSISLRSSTSCSSSLCGSPEPPPDTTRTPSRASSYSSLNETIPQTTIKIFTACLRLDIEYKTLGICWDTTSRQIVGQVLRRCKMRHRDPRLFYLSMEVTVRRAGVRTLLVLDDEACPAILQACHPKGDSRFCLQLKPGGLVRVHTSALQPSSQYKSLLISEETTSDEVLGLLLQCFNSAEPIEQFSIYEVCPGQECQRKLHPDDLPLRAQLQRLQRGDLCHFLVRRNPNYPRRRQLLPPITEKNSSTMSISSSSLLPHTTLATTAAAATGADEYKKSNGDETAFNEDEPLSYEKNGICQKCRNNFKSCEFCKKNFPMLTMSGKGVHTQSSLCTTTVTADVEFGGGICGGTVSNTLSPASSQMSPLVRISTQPTLLPAVYHPVYNIREIRTVSHSFSSMGSDKKLLDVVSGLGGNGNSSSSNNINGSSNGGGSSTPTMVTVVNKRHSVIGAAASFRDLVKSRPAKGFSNFLYI